MEPKRIRKVEGRVESHNFLGKVVEVHGHMQCAECGRVIESCCEGAPPGGGNISPKKSE